MCCGCVRVASLVPGINHWQGPHPRDSELALPRTIMSIVHGIKQLGVLGAGQMGTGIAFVSAVRAKVPVLLHDSSPTQLTRAQTFLSTLLSKDVSKGRLTPTEAAEAKDRVRVVDTLVAMRDVDMVVEAVSEQVELKKRVFRGLRETLNEEAILASNTSSISITKIAAATVPEGVSASSVEGLRAASRVVGERWAVVGIRVGC